MRLSRRVLIGGAVIAIAAITGGVWWALQDDQGRQAPQELYTTDRHATADGLAGLPKDYTGLPREVPQLGSPLPGDLGVPMLGTTSQSATTPTIDPEAQRLAQEREAALTSRLFVHTDSQQQVGIQAHAASSAAGTAGSDLMAQSPKNVAVAGNGQDGDHASSSDAIDTSTTSTERLTAPVSPYVVQEGTIIPAGLITGIKSDLPGKITAQVTEDVYDSPTGQFLLIPQGARLIGRYDSRIAFGQTRVLVIWTRLIMPSGASIVLDRLQGVDTAGYSGLNDGVDNHWSGLFQAAILSTILSVGSEAGTSGNENGLIQAIRGGASNSFNQTGQQIVQRDLGIQPTLTIRPGFPVDVMVDRDLVLKPYGG